MVLVRCLLVLLAATAPSSTERFPESTTVHLVEVDVAVSDLAGRPILDLTHEDFEVFDGGLPIRNFRVEGRPRLPDSSPASSPAHRPTEADPRPLLVIVFHRRVDNLARSPTPFVTAARDLGDALERGDYDDSRVALVCYQERLWLVADFEDQPRRLAERARKLHLFDRTPDPRPAPTSDPSLRDALPGDDVLAEATSRFESGMILLADVLDQIDRPARIHLFSPGWGALTESLVRDPVSPFRDLAIPVTVFDVSGADHHSSEDRLADLAGQTGGAYYPSSQLSHQGRLRNALATDAARYRLVWPAPVAAGDSGYRPIRIDVRRPFTVVSARAGYRF